ncbi:MAG: VWA domain-containing protein [Acidobacteria bacterium]|nr:VWA domain-containing protein [Acidobacteriota bacterium]
MSRSGLVLAACLVAASGSLSLGAQTPQAATTIRITSPLGRTGLPGTIRIVARLEGQQSADPPQVSFYIDKLHLADDTDGPPYEALWSDDNPFEAREISVRAEFSSGAVATDTLALNALVVSEAVEVMSIAIEASVVDAKGRFVRNLEASDFTLLENAEAQALDLVTQRRQPALFALLVDSSQSMSMRYSAVRAAASQLLEPLHPDDAVIVAPFAREITTVTGPTTDHNTVLEAIGAIRPTGGTAILDAIQQMVKGLPTGYERRAVILITDGYDEHSTAQFEATIAALRASSVTMYVIGVGGVAGISLKGETLLSRLAEQTGGRAWFPRDRRRLIEAYATTAEDVQQRYLLTYTPSNQRRDGTLRTITVKTRTPDLVVRARESYTAPMAPPIRASLEFTAIGQGQQAAALMPEDLVVLEDGVPQKVDTFQEAVLPVTFMLALDSSGSMIRSAERAQEAARGFVMSLRSEDRLGMIMFADRAEYIHSPMVQRDDSIKAIDTYKAKGGTALYDAVYDSLAQISDVKGRRVVIVVTDGRDENAASNGPGSLRAWEDVLRKLEQTEAAVYPVGVGTNVDKMRLQELADRSGGTAYFPQDVNALAADYGKILDELRRRYVVGYESTNRARNGGWRKVEVSVRHSDVRVRSRGGYFAPSQ